MESLVETENSLRIPTYSSPSRWDQVKRKYKIELYDTVSMWPFLINELNSQFHDLLNVLSLKDLSKCRSRFCFEMGLGRFRVPVDTGMTGIILEHEALINFMLMFAWLSKPKGDFSLVLLKPYLCLWIYGSICGGKIDLAVSANVIIFNWANLYVRRLHRDNNWQVKGNLCASAGDRFSPYLFGMSLASLEKCINWPCTSIPTLKASSRSRPENFWLEGRASVKAMRTGRTAPEGWVAGCHVSSKSIEWICVNRHTKTKKVFPWMQWPVRV